MHFNVISLMPEWINSLTHYGVVGKAFDADQIALHTINPRDFTDDVHRTVDDRPYGGGPGMVLKAEPLEKSLTHLNNASHHSHHSPVIYLTPHGRPWTQPMAQALSQYPAITLICGRYEGIDQRFIDQYVDLEISIGDVVLSGGELAAMMMIDSIARLLPGVLGHEASAQYDSFSQSGEPMLDCPHYTRPPLWNDTSIPATLKSGDHQRINTWRAQQSLKITWQKRPETLKSRALQKFNPLSNELLDDD